MEKIKIALKDNELDLFLVGEGKYKMSPCTDLPEPNDYNKCWMEEIIPYSKIDTNFPLKLKHAFFKLLNYEKDINLGIYTLISSINWYYFFQDQKMLQFEIPLDELSNPIKVKLRERKLEFINDKRWAGVEWNSKNGIWGPLMSSVEFIKNKYHGVDLVP